MELIGNIESILFVASKPLSAKTIARALDVQEKDVVEAIEELKMRYNQETSGIYILEIGDEVQMGTNPDAVNIIDGFMKDEVAGELTKAQLETLTVIAYRGPVTRAELEQIRGVNCALILRNLLQRGLVEERAGDESVFPSYTLSFEALRHLGVTSVTELPDYDTIHGHKNIEVALNQNDEARSP